MTIEVRVPQLPESVADATVVSWNKKPGDAVARDENLVDLETDKVVLEVPAPAAGLLKEIRLKDGTTVTSGQVLAVIEEGAAASAAPAGARAAAANAAKGAAGSAPTTASSAGITATTAAKPDAANLDAAKSDAAAAKLSPAAKRVVEENKIDPKAVAGSGRDGRVSKSDVVNFLSAKDAAPPPASKAPAAPAPIPSARGARAEQRVPMTRLRARIAERMVQAQATQALLTSFNEVDLKAVNELRARY